MLLRAICTLVLLGILVAGLWPFHTPRNEVNWLSQENGIILGKHGSIVSEGSFKARASRRDDSCSLEIWLKPSRVYSEGMILAFYRPESRIVPFALRQYRGGLIVEHNLKNRFDKKMEMYIGDVFNIHKPVLVTITSGNAGTVVYLDGAFVKRAQGYAISNQDLTGRLVVGNAASTNYHWSGQLKGIAVYDRELSAPEVSESFLDLTKSRQLNSVTSEDLVARYLFDEGDGNVVHNRADPATDLLIPERFFVLNGQFLERPWDEYQPSWSYWKDIGINIVGFIPLGFCFYAYFCQFLKSGNSAVAVIALGFAVSLTIEVLQSFLPTRDSGMTDLFTNTLGTAIGVMIFRHRVVQAVLGATDLCKEKSSVSVVSV